MDDFTKTKLINNLIDLVDHFYRCKQSGCTLSQVRYLKGFCEGIAHTLVEASVIEREEAKRILKGIGKKRPLPAAKRPEKMSEITSVHEETATRETANKTETIVSQEMLDVPTIFRKEMQKKEAND